MPGFMLIRKIGFFLFLTCAKIHVCDKLLMLNSVTKKLIIFFSVSIFVLTIGWIKFKYKNPKDTKNENNLTNISSENLHIINNPGSSHHEPYPSISSEIFQDGLEIEILTQNVHKFYSLYWNKMLKKVNPESSGVPKIEKIVSNPETDIKITMQSESLAGINRTALGLSEFEDIYKTDDIWYFSGKRWKPVLDFSNHFYKSQLLHLNNDNFIDIIIKGGCCDTETLNVYLGNESNSFSHIQDITIIGNSEIKFNDKCDNLIKVSDYHSGAIQAAFFNCDKNRFIRKK